MSSISGELISRWTATGERARCVTAVMLTSAVVHRTLVDVCNQPTSASLYYVITVIAGHLQWRNYKFGAPLLQNIVIELHESQILIETER